jgi:hypothetical protein
MTAAGGLWVVLVAVTTPAVAGAPGDSGFLSLRFAVGARESAMGGAGVAATSGAAAVIWNPSRLLYTGGRTDLLLQHQRLYGLFDRETAALAHRAAGSVLGVYFSGFYADDIDRYGEAPVGIPEGTFAPYDVVVGLAYARQVVAPLTVGAAVKLLHEKIDTFSDTGYAFDLFLTHQATIPGLTFAASLTNLGPQLQLRNDASDQESTPFSLPAVLRVGAAYDPVQAFFAGKVTFAGDVVFPNDGNAKAHAGIEYRLRPDFALRAGSRVNYESQGLTAGAGFRRGTIEVGYAYEDMQNDLDPSHKFVLELHY